MHPPSDPALSPLAVLLAACAAAFGGPPAQEGALQEGPAHEGTVQEQEPPPAPEPAPAQDGEAGETPAPEDAAAADPSRAALPPLLLEGAIVHTMLPGEEPRAANVLIQDGRILSVSAELDEAALPEGVARVDATGRHVVPALIDGYVSFDSEHDLIYTVSGIGVVRDMGGDYLQLLREREEARRVSSVGPALLTAGAVLDGDPPSVATAAVLRDAQAAATNVPILIGAGVDFLSCHLGLTADARAKVIELAHANGLDVWSPLPLDTTLEELVASGIDGVYPLDALRPPSVPWQSVMPPAFRAPAKLLAENGTYLVPLFYASALRVEDQSQRPDADQLLALLSPVYQMSWRSELAARAAQMTEERHALERRVVDKQGEIIKALYDAGVHLVPGSGAARPWIFPGRGLHRELELWVLAGIPDAEVLRFATRRAAEAFGIEDEYGSIQPGAVASLLILDGDPEENIASLGRMEAVISRGRLLTNVEFDAMIDVVAEHQARARAAINAPVEVAPPPIPEDAEVLLGGTVESRSFGLRLWTECFRVARKPDGVIMYLGRVVYPDTGGFSDEMLVSQIVEDGRLVGAEVALKNGDQVLRFEGVWTAGSWRMRRLFGNESMGNTSSQQQPVVCDVGSITTALVLGHAPFSERFPIIRLHQGLEPESAFWRMELDEFGQHQVRTHVGRMAFRFDGSGAPETMLTLSGTRGIETVLMSSELFGGPGHPLPIEKQALITVREREARAREAAAKAAAEQAGEGDGGADAPDAKAGDEPVEDPAGDAQTGDDGPRDEPARVDERRVR